MKRKKKNTEQMYL